MIEKVGRLNSLHCPLSSDDVVLMFCLQHADHSHLVSIFVVFVDVLQMCMSLKMRNHLTPKIAVIMVMVSGDIALGHQVPLFYYDDDAQA